MKIQCACGAKFEFEVTSEMANAPVRFICPKCGADASAAVDSLVRTQLGQTSAPLGTPIGIGPGSSHQPPKPKLAVRAEPHGDQEPPPVRAIEGASAVCPKHPGHVTVESCRVCGKPICPKCMELFGYVCSPLCRAKANSHGVAVPEFEGQKAVKEARLWRRTGWVAAAVGAVAVVLLGFWFWYAWFGSIPKPIFSVRFPDMSYSGQSAFSGKEKNQLIFLHGGTLSRYGLHPSQKIWSVNLLDRQQFARLAEADLKAMQDRNMHLADKGVEDLPKIPAADKLIDQLQRSAEAGLMLYVRGENIWVESPGKWVRYDWETGKPVKELPVPANASVVAAASDDVTVLDTESQSPNLIHINLTTCETRTEGFENKPEPSPRSDGGPEPNHPPSTSAGLPQGPPGRDLRKPMDPAKVAEQAQHLSLAQKLALPATLGNSINQERQLALLNEQPKHAAEDDQKRALRSGSSLIPTQDGFIVFSVRVLESRIVERSAMKATSGKRGLDEGLTAGNSMEAAGEMLNQMQRERGGDTVQEDLSRYEVTIRQPGSTESWTGEVIGPPRLFPLHTVSVLTAGKTFVVFDKHNRLLWRSLLSFEMPNVSEAFDEQSERFGEGPCVEHDGSLYIFDQGFLACFELATGNRRWGLPSVGVAGVWFDNHKSMYVNTTSAGPDKLRYSRQIDISQKINPVVLKVDAGNGKILWKAEQLGLVSYVSGKLVLTVESYQPDEDDSGPSTDTGFETPPYLRIRRLNANSGQEVWEHFQQRAPLDIGFGGNTIRLVFRKEVQVLRFLMF